ncbi:MAG: PspA/IM30 family protein [Pseudomonadota bacterium]
MFKMLATLIRGNAADATEAFAAQNALPLLRQQLREACAEIEAAKHAIALAMAGHKQEAERAERLKAQRDDLEIRALAALEAKEEALAQEAAQSIAHLDDEITACEKIIARYDDEITTLRSRVREAQSRINNLKRGQRVATANAVTQKLQTKVAPQNTSSLEEAESTLAALEERQRTADLTREARRELEMEANPSTIAKRMADKGLGTPVNSSADDVLARLQAKAKTTKAK